MVEDETGGEPTGVNRFVRSSLRSLAERLGQGSPTTVARLLRGLGFSPRVNVKRFTGPPHPDRDKQFQYLRRQRRRFQKAGCPTISVDAKKKELVGNFRNAGRKWRRQAEAQAPRLLFMTKQDLMQYDAGDVPWDQFPDDLNINGMLLPLEYRLEPGNPADGITVTVPFAMLNQIPPEPFEWLVPGLLKEKILALIRSLPPGAFSRSLTHPERGRMTFQVLVETMAGHDLNHLRQLDAIASGAA